MTWWEDFFGAGSEPPEDYDDFTYEDTPYDEDDLAWEQVHGIENDYGETIYYTNDQWYNLVMTEEDWLDEQGIDPYEVGYMLEEQGLFDEEDWATLYGG